MNRIGTTGALELCTICAKRKTASSKRLLKPWMKTSTCRLGAVRSVRWNQASAWLRSITSALSVTKSVAGLPGTWRGHCTSPICRALGGGIETVMLAKAGVGPRSPENISAGSARLRVVATSMSTWLAPGNRPAHRHQHALKAGAATENGDQGQDHGEARDERSNGPSRFCMQHRRSSIQGDADRHFIRVWSGFGPPVQLTLFGQGRLDEFEGLVEQPLAAPPRGPRPARTATRTECRSRRRPFDPSQRPAAHDELLVGFVMMFRRAAGHVALLNSSAANNVAGLSPTGSRATVERSMGRLQGLDIGPRSPTRVRLPAVSWDRYGTAQPAGAACETVFGSSAAFKPFWGILRFDLEGTNRQRKLRSAT